ncbi:MAG: cysteine dioxygenase family protein [Acidobacteriota bacterium]
MFPMFQGSKQLVETLDSCVALGEPQAIADTMQARLSELILSGAIRLPDELREPANGHYARRLLYRSPRWGYVVVAMVWGPGQATPLHDHAGTWCVEGVLEGRIQVTRYDLKERDQSLCRFERHETLYTGIGTAGALIPPFEYHTLANDRSRRSSITIHVYGEDMQACTIFEPQEREGWYREQVKPLSYDRVA